MKYEYTLSLYGIATDVKAIENQLNQAMETLYLAKVFAMENCYSGEYYDNEYIDLTLVYTREKPFKSQEQLDDILTGCYKKTEKTREADVSHGDWYIRKVK